MSPTALDNATIILAYKQRGDREECGNSRGISVISVSGYVLANVMLTRLLLHVIDLVLPLSLPYNNNFIPVCALKLAWLVLSPLAFQLKWK